MRAIRLVLLILVLVPTWSGPARLDLFGDHPRLTATRVPLDPAAPARERVGALDFLGGVHLTSSDRAFGGFSALAVAGDRFTLLGDGGTIVRFRMGRDFQPREARFGALVAGPAAGWEKRDRDAESMVIDPAGRHAWVGFERVNAIWRYRGDLSAGEAMIRPRAMRGWPSNGGPEAMALMPDGGFVVLSESAPGAGGVGRAGLRFARDPVTAPPPFAFTLVAPAGFDPTDAAALPDGRLLVLVRRWSVTGYAARLMVVASDAIRPGAVVRARELARLEAPVAHENYEALAVTRERGRTIVWIASDDNQSWFERTLLLKFALIDPGDASPR